MLFISYATRIQFSIYFLPTLGNFFLLYTIYSKLLAYRKNVKYTENIEIQIYALRQSAI